MFALCLDSNPDQLKVFEEGKDQYLAKRNESWL